MFLYKTLERNRPLIECAFRLHGGGDILPDTYVIDADAVFENARLIKSAADDNGIKLYFMLKQLAHNPYIARRLIEMGYEGAVAVDFREALTLADSGIKLGHIGHLVQIPRNTLKTLLSCGVDIVTVYSLDKAAEIDAAARQLGIVQNIMVRVSDQGDTLYSGQEAGIEIEQLDSFAKGIGDLRNVRLCGVCGFPCLLFDDASGMIQPTHNAQTVVKAAEKLRGLGFDISQLNMPSATCVASMKTIAGLGGTHGEPGHGLTGTTPLHAKYDAPEIPALVYVSEVSHFFNGVSYCYGGGFYHRGHLGSALVGTSAENARQVEVIQPDSDSIDYYIGLNERCSVSETAVMAFRTQIFVTRSLVAVVEGLSHGAPKLVGIYDSLGNEVK